MNRNKDVCEIEITNFRKYHPRKDYKSMPWIKLDVHIFDDPVWARLPTLSMVLWVYLLTVCARKNTTRASFGVSLTAASLGLKPIQVRLMIDRFEENQLVRVISRSWDERRTSPKLSKVSISKASKGKSSKQHADKSAGDSPTIVTGKRT